MAKRRLSTKSPAPAPLRKWRVRISGYRALPGLPSAKLKRILLRVLQALDSRLIPPTVVELSVLFTDDRTICKLNRSYRSKNKPTDVLSFSQLEGPGAASPVLGDIVISLPTARRQARERGVPAAVEVVELLAHGLLHLFGFDHEQVPAREARRMFKKQAQLMQRLGLAPKK